MSGLFVRHGQPGGVERKGVKHANYGAAVSYSEGVDPDSYQASGFTPGGGSFGGATIVPRSGKETSFHDKKANPYGKVVLGKTISGDMSDGSISIQDWEPDPEAWTGKRAGTAMVAEEDITEPAEEVAIVKEEPEIPEDAPVLKFESPEPPPIEKRAEGTLASELDNLMDTLREKNLSDLERATAQNQERLLNPVPVDMGRIAGVPAGQQLQKPASTVKVLFKGPFGTYRGKYRHIYVNPELIILVYDEDADVYSPRPSGETFTVSAEGQHYEVYFMGIEFEMPCIQGGVQVMIRSK
jgi:hypothetical protein